MVAMQMLPSLLVLVAASSLVRSEIIPLELILDASSEEVNFVRGWVDAPGHIDLAGLRFITRSEPDFEHGEDDEVWTDDSTISPNNADPETTSPDDEGNDEQPSVTEAPTPGQAGGEDEIPTDNEGGVGASTNEPTEKVTSSSTEKATPSSTEKETPSPTEGRRLADENGGGQRVKQVMDIILFVLPDTCKRNAWGACDWAALGVGAVDDDMEGGVSYCCSPDTAARGICQRTELGKFMVNQELFDGVHRQMEVPTTEDEEFKMEEPTFEVSDSGDYVLIMSNCYDYGLEVLAVGSMEWKSVGGFLPGDMFGLMFFYAALTIIYFLLVLWYWCGMKMFQDAAIPIQKYIFATMLLGLLEIVCRTLDLGSWNWSGVRSMALVYTSLILGVLKRAISRCLGVMVAMGWGVVRDSLGTTLVKIVFLGFLYAGLTLFRDFLVAVATERVEKMSMTAEEELVDFALILTPMIIVVNLIFYFWILSALNSTTEYLKNMNQTSKLQRHLRLRCLMLTTLLIAAAWLLFTIVDGFMGVLNTDQEWILEGAMHANYLFILTGVAILWRPNSHAKDYAMQMELPALGGEENELELSCVVPSAGDMDDGNDPDHPNGLMVDDAIVT